MQIPLRIGTRGSPLALAQTQSLIAALQRAHGWSPLETASRTTIVTIKTSGDKIQDRPLADVGGKGLFAKEIEEALLAGTIDCAVHSLKDMPAILPNGLVLDLVLPREDPRDALISKSAKTLSDLPQNAKVGSSSVRRQAMLLNQRPDLEMKLLRGNVETRLNKVLGGELDATILALAGLKRLGKESAAAVIFNVDEMLPAVAQGAIGIETRQDDSDVRNLLAPVNHYPTLLAVTVERAFLEILDGSCKTPIGGLAEFENGSILQFTGCALSPDGKQRFDVTRRREITTCAQASELGAEAGENLLSRASRKFFQV